MQVLVNAERAGFGTTTALGSAVLGTTYSSALLGASAMDVRIEAQVSGGLPGFQTVGLPDSAIKESRVRIVAALRHLDLDVSSYKVIINLAPADVRKEGSALDLAMALAVLVGAGKLKAEAVRDKTIIGEIGLDGSLRSVAGTIIHARAAKEAGRALILPAQNASEATLVRGLRVHPVVDLQRLVDALAADAELPLAAETLEEHTPPEYGCFSDVRGQETPKRALVIAAVGGHHVLLHGIPGVGKTMLCERFSGLLPDLSVQEELEVLAMHSLYGTPARSRRPPLRAPHHSLSMQALIGGGSSPRPGEISLAHRGVLFLDELGEFRTDAINAMRQPLESGRVTVSRAQRSLSFEADFQLLAATNPCACGNFNHPTRVCTCSPRAMERYRTRLAGPIADRFDMSIPLSTPPRIDERGGASSATLRAQVVAARAFGAARGAKNRSLCGRALVEHAPLARAAQTLLRAAQGSLGLSGRATDRVLRVARSIADLCACETISDEHLCEAIALRHDPHCAPPDKTVTEARVVPASVSVESVPF